MVSCMRTKVAVFVWPVCFLLFGSTVVGSGRSVLVGQASNELGSVRTWKEALNKSNAKIWFEVKRAGSSLSVKIPYHRYLGRETLSTALEGNRFVAVLVDSQLIGHILVVDLVTARIIRDERAEWPILSPDNKLVVYGEWRGRFRPLEVGPGRIVVMQVMQPDMPTFQLFDRDEGPGEHCLVEGYLWSQDSKRIYFLDYYWQGREEERYHWVTIDLSNGVEKPHCTLQPLNYAHYADHGYVERTANTQRAVMSFHKLEWSDSRSIRFDLLPEHRRWTEGKPWRAPAGELVCFDLRQEGTTIDPKTLPIQAFYWASVFEDDLRPTDEVYKDDRARLRLRRDKVASKAHRMATGERAHRYERIWGFQACEQMGIASALPAARRAVQTSTNASLKAAAAGLIGAVGGPDDVKLLESVLEGTPTARLQAATEKALCRLKERSSD